MVLQPEDELIYLAVHAARHRLERLGSLYDLRLFLERHPLDWTRIGSRARSFGVAHAVALALWAAERRIGVALPEDFRKAGLPGGARLRLVAAVAASRTLAPRPGV